MSDSISQALQSPAIKDVSQIGAIGSTGYNLYNAYQNQQYQNQLRSYAQDPAKMNAYAAKFTQPLTAGLTTGVANNAQAYLAQRGLSDSPQISQQVESQAIAPYIQQNQDQGYQNALQALNLGGGANQTGTGAALAKAFALLGGAGSKLSPALLRPAAQPSIYQSSLNQTPAPNQPIDTSSWPGQEMPDVGGVGTQPQVTFNPDYISAIGGAGEDGYQGDYGLGS